MDRKQPPKEAGEQQKEGDQEKKANQSSSDEDSQGGSQESQKESRKSDDDYSNLERLRKQKRLAMNRESARNRRKFKKDKLETLEAQVARLNKENQGLRSTVSTLSTRITQLESELSVERSTIAALTGSSAQRLPGSERATLPTALPGTTNASSLQLSSARRALPNASDSGIALPVAPDTSASQSQFLSAHARLQNVSIPRFSPSTTGAASAYSLLSATNPSSIEALSSLLGPGNRMSPGTADLVAQLQQGYGGRQSGIPLSLHHYAAAPSHRSSLTSGQSGNQAILAESMLASGRPTGIAGSLLNENNLGQGNQQGSIGVDNIVRMLRQDQTRGDVFRGDLRRFGTQNSEGQPEFGTEASAEVLARLRRGNGSSDPSGANSSRRPSAGP